MVVMDEWDTLRGFLQGIASPGPAGGGGAASALTGATAAALVAMVAGVSAPRAPADAGLREIVTGMDRLRSRLLRLIERDIAAFGRVVEARRDPGATRAQAVREALMAATEVPLEMAAAGAQILEQCVGLLAFARPSTRADLGVAGALAAAALEGAVITARANLEALDAPEYVAGARRRLDELLGEGTDLRARLAEGLSSEPRRPSRSDVGTS